MLTHEQIGIQYSKAVRALIEQYGNPSLVPSEQMREVSETARLHYIVLKYEGKVNAELLSRYMLPASIIAKVNPDFEGVEPKVKRADKYDDIYKWLDDNSEVTVTPQYLVELSGMSYPTILKFIENNPQYFRKVKRGTYIVRNPSQERKEEK
jgi:hypothetical protein